MAGWRREGIRTPTDVLQHASTREYQYGAFNHSAIPPFGRILLREDSGRINGASGFRVLDTLTIARTLTDAKLTPEQANAITDAVRQAAEHGDHVTSDQFAAGIAKLELRLIRWIVATAAAGVVIAAMRSFG